MTALSKPSLDCMKVICTVIKLVVTRRLGDDVRVVGADSPRRPHIQLVYSSLFGFTVHLIVHESWTSLIARMKAHVCVGGQVARVCIDRHCEHAIPI